MANITSIKNKCYLKSTKLIIIPEVVKRDKIPPFF